MYIWVHVHTCICIYMYLHDVEINVNKFISNITTHFFLPPIFSPYLFLSILKNLNS